MPKRTKEAKNYTDCMRKCRLRAEKEKALEEERRVKSTFESRLRTGQNSNDRAGNWFMNIFAVIQVMAIIYYLTH